MIARLRGRLDSFDADHAVLDVNGVGYLVFASPIAPRPDRVRVEAPTR